MTEFVDVGFARTVVVLLGAALITGDGEFCEVVVIVLVLLTVLADVLL